MNVSPYLKMLRLQDQYPFLFAVIIAGIYLQDLSWWILWWGIGASIISVSGFILNEWVDRKDVDKGSWNPFHVDKDAQLDPKIVVSLFFIFMGVGLWITSLLGFFWWGMAIFVLEFFYSIKPIRLKGIFLLDILVQEIVMQLIPFFAVILRVQAVDIHVLYFIVPVSLITIGSFFQYQIADYKVDKENGLFPTHVVLGLRGSYVLGSICSFLGIVLFFIFRVYDVNLWTWVGLMVGIYTLYRYMSLIRTKDEKKQLQQLQCFILRMKSFSQWLVVALFLWWRMNI